jgi:hypothetical protein
MAARPIINRVAVVSAAVALLLAVFAGTSPVPVKNAVRIPVASARAVEVSVDIESLIAGLSYEDQQTREDAAEALADIVDPRIPDAIRKCIAVEEDFHVQLALHYALASQGDKPAVLFLIESLREKGHLGYLYLRGVSERDYGWKIDEYRAWYAKTSDEQFRSFIMERWKRKPMMEAWSEFASLHATRIFNTFENLKPFGGITTDEVERRLEALPTAAAWTLFESALNQLQEKGDRRGAARLFREVATKFADTYYAEQSQELADLLDKMVREDARYTPPVDVGSRELKDQIAFHIHNLRDVVGYQSEQPGYCSIVHQMPWSDDQTYDAAIALRDIGEPAVPQLIELLGDRRPIRAVGYWRDFHPTRTVLRYQDAAIQIISAIRSEEVYDRRTTDSYFSTEPSEVQQAVIDSLKESIKGR